MVERHTTSGPGIARAGSRLAVLVAALAGCGRSGHVAEATVEPSVQGPGGASAPAAPLRAPATTAPDAAVASASTAAPVAPAPATSTAPSASASAAPAPPVVEARWSALRKKLSVSATGEITTERAFEMEPEEVGHGQVTPARVEALHQVLREAGLCALAPKQRESALGYIVIQARFPDVACSVELPDKRWETDRKAKRIIDAVRALESEGCPKGCKP